MDEKNTVHIEVKQATVRRFAAGKAFERADPYNLIVTLDFIGRGEVQLSGDLASEPIARPDLRELRRQLVRDYGVHTAYCWRAEGHKPPFKGRIVRKKGGLVYWEMPLSD